MAKVVSVTLFQAPPPTIVVETQDPAERLRAKIDLPTPWPTGTGLLWYEAGRS
jgi:hypothetical protein